MRRFCKLGYNCIPNFTMAILVLLLMGCGINAELTRGFNNGGTNKAYVWCSNGVIGATWNVSSVDEAVSQAKRIAQNRGGIGCHLTHVNAYTGDVYYRTAALESQKPQSSEREPESENPKPETSIPIRPEPVEQEARPKVASTGTGFFVNRDGDVVTNEHVVNQCRFISIHHDGSNVEASIKQKDAQNDLALLTLSDRRQVNFARLGIEKNVRLGESIITIGYPLSSVLSTYPKVTDGTISSMAGIKDDTRYLQISAPIQPGNSGGPLLNQSGDVIGVVSASLNSNWTIEATGAIPQNVNFAIKSGPLKSFLDTSRTRYATSEASSHRLETPDIIDAAQGFVVQVICWE